MNIAGALLKGIPAAANRALGEYFNKAAGEVEPKSIMSSAGRTLAHPIPEIAARENRKLAPDHADGDHSRAEM